MKLKLSESQYKRIFLKEQSENGDDKLEKTLSSFTYLEKPFSCVANEPMDIKGKKIFPTNYPKKVVYYNGTEDGEKKVGFTIGFKKMTTGKHQVVIQVGVIDEDKRMQMLEIAGFYKCGAGTNTKFEVNRRIEIKITDILYYQARPDGGVKDPNWEGQTNPITPKVFGGEMSKNTVYNSLEELSKDINNITINFDNLQNIT